MLKGTGTEKSDTGSEYTEENQEVSTVRTRTESGKRERRDLVRTGSRRCRPTKTSKSGTEVTMEEDLQEDEEFVWTGEVGCLVRDFVGRQNKEVP